MSKAQLRWLLVVAGVLLWVLAIFPAYYVVHKPIGAANFRALASTGGNLLAWLAMTATASALGSRLTRGVAYDSLLERLVFSTGLGLGVFSLVVLGLALLGWLYAGVLWGLLLVGALLLWREFQALARALRQVSWPRPTGPWTVFLSMFMVATLLLALVQSLTPPIEWDALTYHLVGPDRYLQAHRFTFDFDIYYLYFPSFTEMLFTAGMALKSDIVARLLHFTYLPLTVGALAAFAQRHWEERIGLVAGALFLSIPTAVQIASWAYVDLALTFYSFAAFSALFNWLQAQAPSAQGPGQPNQARGWLVLAGLSCGACASIKYTGVSSLIALGAVVLWATIRKRLKVRSLLVGGGVVVGLTVAVAGAWYVKNALVTGNPIYPLVWGGEGWNEISERWLLVLGEKKSVLDLFLTPWTLTVLGQQGTVAYDATISPLFLLLLPMLLLVQRDAPGIGDLLLVALVGYAAWIVSGAAAYGTFVLRGRQLLAIFAPLALLCAYALQRIHQWDRPKLSVRRLLKMIVALTLAIGFTSQVQMTIGLGTMDYLLGYESRDDHLEKYVAHRLHQATTYLNQNLTKRDKVFLVWEPRSYGVEIPHRADVLLDNFAQHLARYGTPEGMVAGLVEEGYSYVLVNHYVAPWIIRDYPITTEEVTAWQEFRTHYLTEQNLVHAEGEYLGLYRLPATGVP